MTAPDLHDPAVRERLMEQARAVGAHPGAGAIIAALELIGELRAAAAHLENALMVYGEHVESCALHPGAPCVCGLTSYLETIPAYQQLPEGVLDPLRGEGG